MKGLDFKDWMKIASDNKSTTLQHKKGHVMTIAHSALPKIQQEQLKRLKLADGGSVDDVPEPNKKNAQDFSKGASESGTPSLSEAYTNLKKGLGYAEGGSVDSWTKREDNEKGINKGHAGMHIKHGEGDPDSIGAAKLSHKKVLKEMKEMPERKLYADSEEPVSKDDSAPTAGSAPVAAPTPTNITINAAPSPQAQPAPQSQPAQTSQPIYGTPLQQAAAQQVGAVNEQGQGLKEQQGVEAQLAQNAEVTAKAKAEFAASQAQQQQDHINMLNNATDIMRNKIQAIRPNAYLEDMPAGRKAVSAIGLVLGGMGQGLIGGDNPAMTFLNDQIHRNVAAQQQNNENQKTIWGAYKDLFGEQNIATKLATASEYDRLDQQAAGMAAKLGTQQAAAKYQMLHGQLINGKNKELMDAAGILQNNPALYNHAAGKLSGKATGQPLSVNPNTEQQPKGKENAFNYKPEPILAPDAEQKLEAMLKYDTSKSEAEKQKILEQYNNAKQADEYLQALPSTFNDMANNATGSGHMGRSLEGLPYIGHGVEGAISGLVGAYNQHMPAALGGTGENEIDLNRKYRSGETNLREALQNSSHGPAASPGGVERTLEDNKPELHDLENPSTYLQKLKAMESYIKKGQQSGVLDAAGLTNSSRKKGK